MAPYGGEWGRKDIEEKTSQGSLKRKRVKAAKFEDVEEILAEWFHEMRSQHVPVDGLILRAKAKEIAGKNGYGEDFTASNGWITRFQKRNEIKYRKISGESEAVDVVTVDAWKNDILPGVVRGYHPKDVFNCDELGLFYILLPEKSMTHRSETCHGGKHSKERVTILLACNQDGSEKLKPYMIGKSQNPRCFKNVRHFPFLDGKMRTQGRRILLLADNCPAHPKDLEFLTNIKAEYLPPNTTSHTQPLDMGIIKVLKQRYRQKLVRRLITLLSRADSLDPKECKINVFQAMHYIAASWDDISKETIQNCFRKAGLHDSAGEQLGAAASASLHDVDDEDDPDDPPIAFDDCFDAPPGAYSEVTERWEEVQQFFDTTFSFEDFVSSDDFTPVCEVQDIDGIIATLGRGIEGEEDVDSDLESGSDGEEGTPSPDPVTRVKSMSALDTVRHYLYQLSGPEDEVQAMQKQKIHLNLSR
ncbi:Tigger transposable element-derived protein 6 [Frankliniella fusca]|uniref:Tigger transposable element-derived protein 6 n=1 Tax=Frankliniella fusca TaxID=407009 RepID=A0AAE1H8I4_9NEOP|nr:Tigger transposable element-derived protein 6 [Frankliniella fusca]